MNEPSQQGLTKKERWLLATALLFAYLLATFLVALGVMGWLHLLSK